MSLQDKVVVVTGGSKGIGRAIVIGAAAQGAKVVVNYSSDSSAADEVVRTIGSERAFAVRADNSKTTELQTLVDSTIDKFGRIDVLIPNAAVMHMRTVENTSEEDFDVMFNTNVKGPYFLVQVNKKRLACGFKTSVKTNVATESTASHARGRPSHFPVHDSARLE